MKIKVIGNPKVESEEFVKRAFISSADKLGFIISQTQVKFPDCIARDMRPENKYDTYSKDVYIEFEYKVENFIAHGHDKQMQDPVYAGKHFIVISWLERGKDKLIKIAQNIAQNIEIIILSDFIEPVSLPVFNLILKQEVYIVPYNSKKNKGYPFTIFKSANIFRTNQKFGNKHTLPEGSIIVIYEDKNLIGEFTVERYEWIEQEPNTDEEKKIYSLLSTVNYLPSRKKDEWVKGHIKYGNLFLYSPKIPYDVMSRGGIKKIDFNDLQKIRARTILI